MTIKVVPLLISGEVVHSDINFDVVNPGTGKVVFKATGATPKHATAAIDAAQKSFSAWSRTKPNTRRDLFFKAAKLLEERQDEVTEIQIEETSVESRCGIRQISDGYDNWNASRMWF
jgi:acyl-CoA reductase-like NAD-dependent aldehyde dehydrogenase